MRKNELQQNTKTTDHNPIFLKLSWRNDVQRSTSTRLPVHTLDDPRFIPRFKEELENIWVYDPFDRMRLSQKAAKKVMKQMLIFLK